MKNLFIFSIAFLASSVISAEVQDKREIAEKLCYALQATMQCDGLSMHPDTQEKINSIVGSNIQEPGSPFEKECNSGIVNAMNDKDLCNNAKKKFGCRGSDIVDLVQEKQSGNVNPCSKITKEEVAENFCYALQASAQCDNLSMRLDTEEKVNASIGVNIRSPNSPLKDNCNYGLAKAIDDKHLCKNAWDKFGCDGTEMPNLIQENPFGNKNGKMCVFNAKK